MQLESLIKRTYGAFAERFDHALPKGTGNGIVAAPGRINIIGEHTDYNDGFVLPMAIDRYVAIAFEVTTTGSIEIWSEHAEQSAIIELDSLQKTDIPNWILYASGMAWALMESGVALRGARLAVCSNLPIGAGVSSSAAFEVGLGMALACAEGIEIEPVEIARAAHKSDHEFVGIPSGIMDQFASACCLEDHALLLDCRDQSFSQKRLPNEAAFVVIDTGKRRELVEGAYAERVASCRKAVSAIQQHSPGVESLRSVSLDQLQDAKAMMDDTTFRRARHVVTEMQRPIEVATAFKLDDLELAGQLMDESHRSLADDYEVSCEELDFAVEIAREHPGCFGARLTGAGFGGCAIALCHRTVASDAAGQIQREYVKRFGTGTAYPVAASSGVRIVSSRR